MYDMSDMTGKVGIIASIRRLRIMRNEGSITTRQAIAWFIESL